MGTPARSPLHGAGDRSGCLLCKKVFLSYGLTTIPTAGFSLRRLSRTSVRRPSASQEAMGSPPCRLISWNAAYDTRRPAV